MSAVVLALAAFAADGPATLLAPPETEMQQMVACESGGIFADSCQISCHVIFTFYTKSCSVTCRSGFFACCNCDGGCQCVLDHEEVDPVPPDRPYPLW
ncbi:MAG TPA: hypothetical protein VFV19_00720 [Candidatus Polarisedimenticolaceae bacterium]|nr:hypothetical protein [Candidatus Polarisedimenticolaceae bacterium]